MPEIRDILDGESRSVDLEPGDFDRLLRRRERLQRNRRIRGGVAGVLVVLVTGLALARSIGGDGAGLQPAGSGSPTVSPTSSPTPLGEEISFGPFGDAPRVRVIARLPEDWSDDSKFGAMSGPDPTSIDAPDGVGVLFFATDGIFSDPCHWDVAGTGGADSADVEVGPTVGDLIAAIEENTFSASTAPTPVTIDGYSGRRLEIRLPDDDFTDCDKESGDTEGHAYLFPIAMYVRGPANIWELTVLDIDGTRVVAAVLSYPETSQADLDAARAVIDTMDIRV